jgi:hypothetical protein
MQVCFMRISLSQFSLLTITTLTQGFLLGQDSNHGNASKLPFAPTAISRLSLDDVPRSMSIRQGADVWLGYDLERATVFKVWQRTPGKSGLLTSGFVSRSQGTIWFDDTSDQTWTLMRQGKLLPLVTRYLGCSHRNNGCELQWEFSHEHRNFTLYERVPLTRLRLEARATREMRVEGLRDDEQLWPPQKVRDAWKLNGTRGDAPPILNENWQALLLRS